MRKPKIAVVGSSSMDLLVTSERRPLAGETVLGDSFQTVPGGKGANQAVAAAKLGAEVYMIGCVGDDPYGDEILANFNAHGVHTDYVEPVTHAKSGTAHIILAEGDNSIVVVKGANDAVTPAYVNGARDILRESDLVLIQQELPEETVIETARLCGELNVPLLLNPAPAREIPDTLLEQVTYITPNEHEAALMFPGQDLSDVLRRYSTKLFITEGAEGVRYFNGEQEVQVPSFLVDVVDTTGAGDTFNAAFGTAMAEGQTFVESLRFANRAASLSVQGLGAQGGMPTREEVEKGLME
ncbi:ribokinase [Pontibacillus halophilus JSM 076056 = DSM 19796]|uniref:Ribokinase n=1 Tax=Pontibacillus halophilus JSM 076056 = DSM 19796 TaxID=1385510 RepID=A0A0A5GC22_9BACI|nr:ribokinase [Pontibacillus halophilus]KGX90736.1 ribokinase [Pontibacillus halophilus JSM 076056 = DSM 19796]